MRNDAGPERNRRLNDHPGDGQPLKPECLLHQLVTRDRGGSSALATASAFTGHRKLSIFDPPTVPLRLSTGACTSKKLLENFYTVQDAIATLSSEDDHRGRKWGWNGCQRWSDCRPNKTC